MDKVLNKKILIAIIISLIIISSAVLYSFYIPNNDVLVNENVNYKNNANILSNNKTDLFIINMTLINVPTGMLYISTLVNETMVSNVNSTISNTGIYKGTTSVTYSVILSRDIAYQIKNNCGYTYTQKDNFTPVTLGVCNGILLRNGENVSNHQLTPIPVKSNNIYTLSFIINETNCCLNKIKNPHNYSYYLKFTLDKISIVDHTHGYYHNFYFVNGKNHYTSPKIKITNITT